MTIDVTELEEGASLIKGVQTIDKARRELQVSRKVVKQIHLNKLKLPLIVLCDAWRARLNRSLQHFLNMVLAPLDQVGEGRTKVTLLFGGDDLSSRSFTVSVMPKEKRAIRGSCSHHLQVLQHAVTDIDSTVALVREVAAAFNQIAVAHKHRALQTLIDTIIDAATAQGKDKLMDPEHQFSSLQSTLKECRDSLLNPDIVSDLAARKAQRRYWETTPLKEHVQKAMKILRRRKRTQPAIQDR